MKWRLAWAKAQVTPVVASSLIWIVVVGLVPAWLEMVLLATWLGAVIAWTSPAMLRLRYSASPLRGEERDAVLRALVPVESMRGRHQPRVWRSGQLVEVLAPDLCNLVWPNRWVDQITKQRLEDLTVSAMAVRAMGLAPLHSSRVVATVQLFTWPWELSVRMVRRMFGRSITHPLGRISWHGRWVVFAAAGVDLYTRVDWLGLAVLAMVAAATVTTGRWAAAWAGALAATDRHCCVPPGWAKVGSSALCGRTSPQVI